MMISTTTLTRTARVALQGYLTAAFFKEIVIDRTIQVISRSEKVSISLVTSTVCSSTTVLLLATAKAARQFLSDDFQCVPAHKDVDNTAEPNAPFSGDKIADAIATTKAFGTPVQPSSSHAVTESIEPAFDGPTEGLFIIDSDTTLIASGEYFDEDVFFGDCVSDTTDLDSLADESTFYEEDCQVTAQCLTDDEPENTLHVKYDTHTIDNLTRAMSALSLDDVPSHISTYSLDNVSSHISTISLADVPSEYDSHTIDDNLTRAMSALSLDDVPSHISTISLADVPSHLFPLSNVPSHFNSTHSLDNVSFDDPPSRLSTLPLDHVSSHLLILRPHVDNGSPHSSKCQPQRTVVHDHAIDDLVRKMVALSLDNVPSQLSKFQPHLHDHAINALLQQSKALTLDNYAIDTLLQKSEALITAYENPTIDALALDGNHAINALLQKSEALVASNENSTIDALALDGDHALDALLHKLEALTLDNDYAIQVDALLDRSDAHTLNDNVSQPSKHMLQDNTDDSSSHQHLHRNTTNTLLRNIEAINPRNFNYDTPYTTMLSTPYFETWSLLFLTITPSSHQNVSHNTPY
ncbi:uncharacterized protein HD556DRAFT_283881 [Suillus plorans]|uniref:Uncharacterized protein n=1 Tax=Suillus plorans TaxID=116603 RepID=A0A9P7IXG0_9AGAM|nr:uncharacterized protein HD556DRAFT_283881 [Suillus plorans]KAG1796767.1 hypothetical protein HD556DRAFT_283881 [Suillus plorans]